MTEAAGYERPGFFARDGAPARIEYSFGPQNWFDLCGAECRHTAEAVSVFDQSCFTKFRIEGRDACRFLNTVCAGNVDREIGRLVYTQMLNERGGIEADVTVTRLSETAFMLVSIVSSQTRDLSWLNRHIPDGAHVTVTDMSSGMAMLAVMGPRSRALLEAVSDADFSNEAFPFGTSRDVPIGYGLARASHVTFVGELGWELYIPAEFAHHIHETLAEAGGAFDLRPAGFFAINSMRMEKGFRHWGHDIGEEDTPIEAGLSFAVAFDKPDGFIGRDAVLRQRDRGIRPKRLVQVRLQIDGPRAPLMYHEEPILKDGRIVGSITSGAYGHRVGASLGMGYIHHPDGVDRAFLESGGFEVEIACARYPATVQFAPFYDPKGTRIKAADPES